MDTRRAVAARALVIIDGNRAVSTFEIIVVHALVTGATGRKRTYGY